MFKSTAFCEGKNFSLARKQGKTYVQKQLYSANRGVVTLTSQSSRYVSERDFVAQYLLSKIKESARVIQVADLLDFHIEKRINGGTADLVVEKAGRGLFLIEAKFKKKVGSVERDIEPRDPEVIRQAVNYAAIGGYPYYITCNAKRLILFQLKPSVKAIESEIASFEYERDSNWSETLLKIVLAILPAQLKPLHDTLVDILHEAFNDLSPEFQQALEQKLR